MNIQAMKTLSTEIHHVMPWLQGITDHQQYKELVALMDNLVEDYDSNQVLIDLLFPVIERYEEESEYFREFNERINNMETGIALLRVLKDQHRLTVNDFPEIGGKSLVSQILNGSRQLTIPHIRGLASRFGIPTYMFL